MSPVKLQKNNLTVNIQWLSVNNNNNKKAPIVTPRFQNVRQTKFCTVSFVFDSY